MKKILNILLRESFISLSNNRGFALVMVLMLLASLAALGVWGTRATLIDSRITQNYKENIRALYIAEAGVARAVNQLSSVSGGFNSILVGNDGISGTTDDGILSFGPSVSFGEGIYSVRITDNNDGDGNLFNDSDNRIIVISTGSINGAVKEVQASVRNNSTPLFNMAVFGDDGMELKSNTHTDSYDSEVGAYGGSNVGSNGDIGTNAITTTPSAISLLGNAVINGDALVGPGGNPDTAISLDFNCHITGSKSAASSPRELPSITPPSGLPDKGSINMDFGEMTITSSGRYSSIAMDGISTLTIGGTGEIVIYADSLTLDSISTLKIDSTVAKVTIYVSQTFTVDSNSKINNLSKDPLKMAIFGTDSLTSCTFDSNSQYYGTLYAKNADIILDGNTQVFGAVVGKTVRTDSNAIIHYDEALARNGPSVGSGIRTTAWKENFN